MPQLDETQAEIYRALGEQRWSDATALVESNWAALLSYRVQVVRAVAEALPDSFVAETPRWHSIRTYIGRVLSTGMPTRDVSTPCPAGATAPLDVITQFADESAEARGRGDSDTAARAAIEGLREFERNPSIADAAGGQMLATAIYHFGLSLASAAMEDEALDTLQRAYAIAMIDENLRTAAAASGQLALMHTFAGRRQPANEWIERKLALTSTGPGTEVLRRSIHLAIASRAHDALDFEAAEAALALATERADVEHGATIASHRALFDVFAGRVDPAEALDRLAAFQVSQHAGGTPTSADRYAFAYARAFALSFAGRPAQALSVLDEALADGRADRFLLSRRAATHLALGDFEAAEHEADRIVATVRVWPRTLAEGLLVKAAVALERGDRALASSTFAQALRLATQNGMPIVLAVIPRDTLDALASITPGAEPSDALDAVRGLSNLFVPVVHAAPHLTPQERSVLAELLRSEDSRAKIAARLGLSENTLKVHTQRIYRKFDVRSRDELGSVAARHGLA
ncbi:MAG: LuxR C-terminal-related transcriptional regulator [Microbacteriaceae bacterium]|nr:LuxR C-terminal-related transcriptional regulator [Microbacteriaceae bacterium]